MLVRMRAACQIIELRKAFACTRTHLVDDTWGKRLSCQVDTLGSNNLKHRRWLALCEWVLELVSERGTGTERGAMFLPPLLCLILAEQTWPGKSENILAALRSSCTRLPCELAKQP